VAAPLNPNYTASEFDFYFKDLKPKALIDISGRPIISYLLDNLKTDNIDYIFIPYNKEYKDHNLENFLIKNYPQITFKFFCLQNNTRGAAETINIGINNLNEERDLPVLCLDSDNFYLCDIISQWNKGNCIFSFEDLDEDPIYSYVITGENNEIVDIKRRYPGLVEDLLHLASALFHGELHQQAKGAKYQDKQR